MLTGIQLIIGFLLLLLFGYKLSETLLPLSEKLEKISLGYILGIGIFTFAWFLFNWAGIPFGLESGLILLISLNVLVFGIEKIIHVKKDKQSIIGSLYFKKFSLIEKCLLFLIIFLCFSALIQDIFWPVRYWDSLSLYDFRAKVFAQTGSMNELMRSYGFFSYPLLTSLSHTLVYVLGGTNPLFIYAFMYIFLLINIFCNVKKLNIGRTATFLITALVAISPRLFDHTQWAYTNLPYSVYIALGSIYLYFGIKKKQLGAFFISAILIGLSTWTRTVEPFWLSCVVVAIAFSFLLKKWLWPFAYIIGVGVIMLPWRYLQSVYNRGTVDVVNQVVLTSQGVVRNLQTSFLKPTLAFVFENVIQMYLIYFVLFVVILLIKLIIKSKEWLFCVLIVLNLVLTLGGTLMFAKNTTYWQDIPDSLARMVMFFPVMIVFFLAETLLELSLQRKH